MNTTTNQVIKPINNTPFSQVTNINGEIFLTIGNYRLNKTFETEEQLNEYLSNNTYDIVTEMILIITEMTKKNETKDNL